jgi:hypothetical protein
MNDKHLIKKIQKDLANSNPKIITNNDNESVIKKKFNAKYTEDISDSEDEDLTSYKNRNSNIINQLNNPKKTKMQVLQQKETVIIKKKTKKDINDELEQIENEINNNGKKNTKNNNLVDDSNSNKKNKNNDKNNEDNEHNESDKNDENDDSDEDDEHEYEYTEELKKKVKDYVKNDDRIRELQAELKALNGAKKTAETEILKHLERLGETNINITGGKLRINQYESKEGLKEDLIKEALKEKITDPKIIEFIFEKINEKRTAGGKVQVSLKRTFERGGGKKEKK